MTLIRMKVECSTLRDHVQQEINLREEELAGKERDYEAKTSEFATKMTELYAEYHAAHPPSGLDFGVTMHRQLFAKWLADEKGDAMPEAPTEPSALLRDQLDDLGDVYDALNFPSYDGMVTVTDELFSYFRKPQGGEVNNAPE